MIFFWFLLGVLAFGLPPLVEWMHSAGWVTPLPSLLYESTWLMAGITLVLVVRLRRVESDAFVQYYLLSMVLRLLTFAGYTIWMILSDKESAAANVVYFLVVYVIFTVLEIAVLYRRVSRR